MARAGGHRRTVAAASATVLTSFGLYPAYSGSAWWWAGAGAAASVAAAGTLTRHRRLPAGVCLAGGLAGLLLYLNLVFAAGRSLGAVIPTPASVGYLARLAAQGVSEASRYAPPTPELGGLMLLAAGGIGLTALLTDLIAVRLGSAALAGLPLLLLFAEPFTLSVSRGPVGTVMVFCLAAAGYLTLLSTEGGERIRAWERPRHASVPDGRVERLEVSRTGLSGSRRPPGGLSRIRPPDTRALTAAGRRAGVASMVAALCVPLFVPGLHVTRLFSGGSPGIGGNGGTALGFPDPRTQVSRELRSQHAAPVLAYTTTAADPEYLQVYVLSDLTDSGWQFSRQTSLEPGNATALAPPGLTPADAAPTVSTRVSVSGQTGPDTLGALPAPYPPVRVTAPGTVQAERATLMLFDRGVSLTGLRYSVSSLDVVPSAAALAAASGPPKSIASEYLGVPRSFTPLRALAQRITRSAATPYGKAVDLQDWLADGIFSYSLAAPAVTNAASLEIFLESARTGYCQQFAYAMAVLARLEGIPSRVAYGFTQGTRQRDGSWLVTTHDAHAWPELYFTGYGWLRFEPTPGGPAGQGTAVTPLYAASRSGTDSPSQGSVAPDAPNPAGTTIGGNPGGRGAPPGEHRLPGDGSGGALPRIQPSGGPSPWALAGLSAAGVIVVVACLPALMRTLIRRRRWRRAVSDAGLAEAAWRELRDDLADYRADGPASESPRALARRVTGELGLSADAASALRRVTGAAERARYSARPADGAALRPDSGTVRHSIAASVPRRRRWRARLLPRSVTARATLTWPKKDRRTRIHVRLSRAAPDADGRVPSPVRR